VVLSVTRLWKRGSVDHKRVPALAGVDLERYGGSGERHNRPSIALPIAVAR